MNGDEQENVAEGLQAENPGDISEPEVIGPDSPEPAIQPEGVHCYIGAPGVGKTHTAIRHALTLARSKGQGVLVVDTRAAENLAVIPEHHSIPQVIQTVWGYRGIARIIPRRNKTKSDAFEQLMGAVDHYGACCVVIDEVATWARNITLIELCRVWRHRKVSLFLTTQKVGGDMEQGVLACDPWIHLFRCSNPMSIEWAEEWGGIDPAELSALEPGQYFLIHF